MRFLFLCTKYPVEPGDTYMTSELAVELKALGHDVDVVHIAWNAPIGGKARVLESEHGIRILEIAPRAVRGLGTLVFRATKFLMTSRHVTREMRRQLDMRRYDAVVAWTPALTVGGPLRHAIRAGVARSVLFVFDFFPIHHREIGMVPPGPVYWVAKAWENSLYRIFTAIICNFPGNVAYLRKHFRLRPGQRVISTPLWSVTTLPEVGERDAIRRQYGLPLDRPIAIFGGQITDGRGVEQMLESARVAEASGSSLFFLFVGSGRLAHLVQKRAAEVSNVGFVANVVRDEYLPLVAACDAGMVATVRGVSSFSFPTKTIDYLRAGLPVVAAVESGSDYLDLLARYELGLGVAFDDPDGFCGALEKVVSDPGIKASIRASSIACLEEVFHVKHAAHALLQAVGAEAPLRTEQDRQVG
jgi:glycosyltransferase involved in cell wall biosynthesis